MRVWIFILSLTVVGSCKDDEADAKNKNFSERVFTEVTELSVEVAYETGAEPYTSSGLKQLWEVTKANLEALFEGRSQKPAIVVPMELTAMTNFNATGKQLYSTGDLKAMAKTHRKKPNSGAKGSCLILFVNGYYSENGVENKNVLGVSLTGEALVAVFKPVVESAGLTQMSKNGIEQGTIVHELGHALGLVNTGIPLKSGHQDVTNTGHCMNEECIMFWQNEQGSFMAAFTQQLGTDVKVLFDAACLKDAREF